MLFTNATLIDENMQVREHMYLGTNDNKITYISDKAPLCPELFGTVRDCGGNLLAPAFYNAHSHTAMNLLRGYGENMVLWDWLSKKIFPFEACLTEEDIYSATLAGIAEMLRFGIVGTSDMYLKLPSLCAAFDDGGVRANVSAGTTENTPGTSFYDIRNYRENIEMIKKYKDNSRINPEFSLHAEYTNTEQITRELAQAAKDAGSSIHVHVSETENEVMECKQRHDGKSPVKYLAECGIFDVPAIAAHCVWLDDEDMDILKEKNVSVATCPKSNLKLASGVCPVSKMLDKGINIAVGTDGASSNNNINMLEEIKFFNLLQKGINKNPTLITPAETLYAATRAGALAMGAGDCGLLKEGFKADIVMFDTDKLYMKPVHSILNNLIYSSCGTDVCMTMCDGKILYENGEYTTVDTEKVLSECETARKRILAQLG